MDSHIVQVKIHPAIGVARVGNSAEAPFIGPESPDQKPADSKLLQGRFRGDTEAGRTIPCVRLQRRRGGRTGTEAGQRGCHRDPVDGASGQQEGRLVSVPSGAGHPRGQDAHGRAIRPTQRRRRGRRQEEAGQRSRQPHRSRLEDRDAEVRHRQGHGQGGVPRRDLHPFRRPPGGARRPGKLRLLQEQADHRGHQQRHLVRRRVRRPGDSEGHHRRPGSDRRPGLGGGGTSALRPRREVRPYPLRPALRRIRPGRFADPPAADLVRRPHRADIPQVLRSAVGQPRFRDPVRLERPQLLPLPDDAQEARRSVQPNPGTAPPGVRLLARLRP